MTDSMKWLGNFVSQKPKKEGPYIQVRVFTEFEVAGKIVHHVLVDTEVHEEERAVAMEIVQDALAMEEETVRQLVYKEFIKTFKVEDPATTAIATIAQKAAA